MFYSKPQSGAIKLIMLMVCMLGSANYGSGFAATLSITQKFNLYYELQDPESYKSQTQFYRVMTREYVKLFAAYQDRATLDNINSKEVRLLFRAATIAAFYASLVRTDTRFTNDMAKDLAVLERRHLAGNAEYSDMYKSLVTNREFAEARAFYRTHPLTDFPPLPTYHDKTNEAQGDIPTILSVDATKHALIRHPVDLRNGARIVVLVDPLCHFCHNLLVYMQSHKKLLKLLKEHAVWITPPNGVLEFNTLQKWNRRHPAMQLWIVYAAEEWPMIKRWAVPTFYFLQNGALVTVVHGWPEGGNSDALRKAMRSIGLLPASTKHNKK